MGRSPKASHALLPRPKWGHIALPGGQYGTFCPILPSLEVNMGRPSHITLPGGQYGTASRTRKEGGGEANLVSGRAIWDALPHGVKKGGEGVPNECLLDLMSVDLVFFTVILDLPRVDLDFFAGLQVNGVVDLDFFTVILDLPRVDLDFFAGLQAKQTLHLYQFVVLMMRLTNLYFASQI